MSLQRQRTSGARLRNPAAVIPSPLVDIARPVLVSGSHEPVLSSRTNLPAHREHPLRRQGAGVPLICSFYARGRPGPQPFKPHPSLIAASRLMAVNDPESNPILLGNPIRSQ